MDKKGARGLKLKTLNLQEKLSQSFEDLGGRLNGSESKSLRELRLRSFDYFNDQGFPSNKDEEWKYTSLNKIIKRDFDFSLQVNTEILAKDIAPFLCDGLDAYQLVFVNGVFSKSLSVVEANDNFFLGSLEQGRVAMPDVFETHYGKLADSDQSLVALNTAMAHEGAFVYVKKGARIEKLVQILFLNTNGDQSRMLHSRNLFVVEDRAEAQIFERHQAFNQGHVFSNAVTETSVGHEAHFKHFKLQNDSDTSSMIDSTFVKQGAKSTALVDTYVFSGELVRNNLHFEFTGEYAEAHMDAITLLKGKSLVDHHTFVDHAVPNCQSNQLYKGIYDEKSKGVFNGKVMVRKHAQKTNAFQQNNNLLLSDFSSIDTKPQLEIFADDVACSHGCTIGQLDEEALFYMQTRGIPLKEAKAFLMFAFAGDTLKNITIPELKIQLINLVARELKVDLELNEVPL